MGLTTKQYYSRISKLTKADLIKRKNGKYSLTVLGKIVYEAHTIIGKALNYYWKLKAIESIEVSSSVKIPKEDLSQLINTLIDNQQIKDIILKPWFSSLDTVKEHTYHNNYQQHQNQDQNRLLLNYSAPRRSNGDT
jgi:predicted transcriptional regulator